MSKEADMTTAELFERYIVPNYGRFPLQPSRGEGCRLWDEDGKSYLDFGGGVAVSSLGHAHPAMVKVLAEQPAQLIHCSNLYRPRGQAELSKVLVEDVVGAVGKCFFCNSGTEANEGLIKLARRFGEAAPKADGSPRREIISFSNSFHGRTTGGMAATGQEKIRTGFGPLMTGFKHLEFNDVDGLAEGVSEDAVAILLEPVQGEGGINIASAEFLNAIAELCRERNLLLLFDEIQCGLGRCGELCGWRAIAGAEDIVPDAISWAKGLGGGFPVGAVWIKDRPVGDSVLCDLLGPGTHGSTYGGSPLACAVAGAVVETIQKDRLCENAKVQGSKIVNTARTWGHALLSDVRGLGLMIGFELESERLSANQNFVESGQAASIFAVSALNAAGLLTVPAGPNVVRWLPPLTVSEGEVDSALTIMREVLDTLLG